MPESHHYNVTPSPYAAAWALDLRRLGAAYYTGNCHKWLCAPKGAGFLHVRPDRQEGIQPAVVSHGYNMRRPDRPRLHTAFDWTGTGDPTPWLCVGEAIRFVAKLTGEGLDGLMRRNHALAVEARRMLCQSLGLASPCPESMLGAMAAAQAYNGLGQYQRLAEALGRLLGRP